jgi:hypothetical protein
MLKVFLLAALIAGTAAAAPSAKAVERGQAELTKTLAGRVPGEPVRCLPMRGSQSSQIYSGTAIVFRDIGNVVYVNRPQNAEVLERDDIPVLRVFGSQTCRGDQVRLLDRLTQVPRNFVILGDFVPYRKPKQD